jgi:hypothetical protein
MIAGNHHRHDAGRPALADGIQGARTRRVDQPCEPGECPMSAELVRTDISDARKIIPESQRKNPVAAFCHVGGCIEQTIRQWHPALVDQLVHAILYDALGRSLDQRQRALVSFMKRHHAAPLGFERQFASSRHGFRQCPLVETHRSRALDQRELGWIPAQRVGIHVVAQCEDFAGTLSEQPR